MRTELQKILASNSFSPAERLRRFLEFVVEETLRGRGQELKEYLLALEVFGRPPSFDPRTDAVVRVEARSLRTKLRDYYESEGRQDALVIELPKGHYVPVFRPVERGTEVALAETLPAPGLPKRRWLMAAVVAAGLAVGFGIYAAAGWLRGGSPAPSSIAVLPFLNLTGEPEYDYFADGLVDELTTSLAKMQNLRVVARTSAFQFGGKGQDVRAVGQQLRVGAVLEGSVRKQGERLRITAQLINTADAYHLWSETYERQAQDIFGVQDEIVGAIKDALRLRLAPQHNGDVARRRSVDPEARRLYWRGRYFRNKFTEEGLRRSVELYQQALDRDPRYAEAYAGLASVYSAFGFHGVGGMEQMVANADEAARKALALDDGLAEAHAALAWIHFYYDRDWPSAERGFRLAVAQNPSFAGAHMRYAFGLVSRGRREEAIEECRRAIDLDPVSYLATNDFALILYLARHYDEAVQRARQVLEMDPRHTPAHVTIGQCLAAQGRSAEAAAEFRKVADPYRQVSLVPGRLANALAAFGQRAEALKILQELSSPPAGTADVCLQRAFVYTGLGDKGRALEELERAVAQREPWANYLGVDPVWDPLRSEPQFSTLLHRLGLQAPR